MKKVIMIIVMGLLINSKINAQVDSMKILRDSIYNYKGNYIGKPLSKLINDLKVPVHFCAPDNTGSRAKGLAYYQNTTIFLPIKSGFALRGFEIKLADSVTVNLEDYRRYRSTGEWGKRISLLLGSKNVVSIDKFQ